MQLWFEGVALLAMAEVAVVGVVRLLMAMEEGVRVDHHLAGARWW